MKKIKYITVIAATLIFVGCSDSFLTKKDLFHKQDASYYSTPDQIEEALTGAYSCLPVDQGVNEPTMMAQIMSDDCFGGGGDNDQQCLAIDQFQNYGEDLYDYFWQQYYRGIFRSNMLLKRFDQATYTSVNQQNQDHGEAYFLRAYFYFKLAEFFGTVPLTIDPAPVNLPRASADELFGQIASDLQNAITMMPAVKYQDIPRDRLGHATKWAAEAMMARVFLFYTGYYQKTDMPTAEGGSITKDQVIAWTDDCIANSGHGLIDDFRNLWPYAYDTAEYPYAKNNNLKWIGEDGDNIETVFAIKYSPYGNWSAPGKLSYCNQMVLYNGIRGAQGLNPWGQGWGFAPVNPQLWDSYEAGDTRKKGSIIDVNDPEEFNASSPAYQWNGDKNNNETGYWQKKYMPVQVTSGNQLVGMYYVLYGGQQNLQLWNMQDEVLIRFADVLLMGAELGSSHAQDYFDQVRARAGLASKPVNLDNIKIERRHELAFEGIRYFDLLRWHDAEQAFATASGIPVKTQDLDATYTVTFNSVSGGFVPIPESQIRLSNGVLEQTPGY